MNLYDVVIIGAGVVGTAVSRWLSFYDLNILVLEKEEDVCSGTSKANSAIIHAGHDALPGTLKAKLNIRGSEMMEDLAKELDIPYKRNGALVICFSKDDYSTLEELLDRGRKNGVKDLKILDKSEVKQLEPNITENIYAALHCPTSAIICPFEMTCAFAENACANGCKYQFNTQVNDIKKDGEYYVINNSIKTKIIINAAGVYADIIHNMVCKDKMNIEPRKGDYYIFDKEVGNYVSSTIFQLPSKMGKGVLVTPTIHGNLMIGPSATVVDDKEYTCPTSSDLSYVLESAKKSVNQIFTNKIITSFSGLRAHDSSSDFVIKESENNFIDCAGIESPGLSSAPAIAEMVAKMVIDKTKSPLKTNIIKSRKGIVKPLNLSSEERTKLIHNNPLYGSIVCRCEQVSEGEIVDAIHRNPGAVSFDGVKRRVRVGMGRCQAGFCSSKVISILARELNVSVVDINKNSVGSNMIYKKRDE